MSESAQHGEDPAKQPAGQWPKPDPQRDGLQVLREGEGHDEPDPAEEDADAAYFEEQGELVSDDDAERKR